MRSRILVLSFITLHFWASNAKIIKGIILDKDSIPVEFANIVSFVNDSVADASVSDETGHFRLNVKDNCNRILIMQILFYKFGFSIYNTVAISNIMTNFVD